MAQLRIGLSLALFMAAGCGESHMTTGSDAGSPGSDAPFCTTCEDAPTPPRDGAPILVCDADDAHAATCPEALCDGPDSYAWDGERCVSISCGACRGSECSVLPHSLAECELAHQGCEPQVCRATGGQWLFFTEECEHYRCGLPQLASCLVGRPVCDCGSGRSFVPGAGCIADPSCGEVDPLPPDTLCASSGGTWTPGICCHTECGLFCDLDCAAPGCVCGAMEVFDPIRGCVPGLECFEREIGETCGFAGTRCDTGILCCQRCGGAGCDPDMICQAPVCDSEPTIDECGNNLLAP